MSTLASDLGEWSVGRGPLYDKLYQGLRDLIESGVLAAGARLPSERAFARDLAVSRTTVVAAYESLRASRLVESRHGSGTTVLSRQLYPRLDDRPTPGAPVFRPLLARGTDAESLISFACAGVPGLPVIAETMRSFPQDELRCLLEDTGYLPWGLPALRREIARLLTSEGLETSAEQVLVTTGAHQAITLCASLFVHAGDLVVVENPTYPGCADAFAAAGGRLLSLPTDEEGMVLDDLERLLRTSPVAAVFVIPTFQNPTGSVMAEHRRRRLADIAARVGVPVIEDNALAHARIFPVEVPAPIGSFPGAEQAPVITIGSLSKALWGGLRVGWLRASQPWVDRLARRKVATDLGSGVLDQAVASRLISRLGELQETSGALLRDRLDSTEALLRLHLPDWSWCTPAGGPSLWIRLPFEAGPFCQMALRHGVELVPGPAFSTDGSFADHVRLPFTADPTVMREAVRRLRAASDSMRPGVPAHLPASRSEVVV